MAGKLATVGQTDILTWYFENDQSSRIADSLYLGLYTDTTEPPISAALPATSITELALGGYARIQLLDADWTAVTDTVTNVLKTFTASVDWGNVYGSFICNTSSGAGTLIAVKHFTSGPFNVLNGKTIDVTPTFVIV
ncbi:MAG: hypothetical protein GY928_26005 [Colwellia sp.]|nr:hypothetical protein [Colwellia sp.]